MKLKRIQFSLVVIILLVIFSFSVNRVLAQSNNLNKVEYGDKVVIDSDLDGLTDEGEKQIYKTDPNMPDTDNDGYYDGVEVISGTNPLDETSPIDQKLAEVIDDKIGDETTPWMWYLSRSSGFVAYIFLWLTILFGLSIRNPILKKIIGPLYSFDFHCFLAISAVFWGFVHGVSFIFHGENSLNIGQVFIPFFPENKIVDSGFLALGIVGFYLMIVLTITSYLRSLISYGIWRATHFLHVVGFFVVVVHGFKIGADMQNVVIKNIFISSAYLMVFFYVSSFIFAIHALLKRRVVNK